IGKQIVEMIQAHDNMSKAAAQRKAVDLLGTVGIPQPAARAQQYPHEFSGGMRQRAMIAMALSCNPAILVADEPTTALDVTVQAQILDLMLELQEDFHSSIMMITHNLGVVSQMADHVAVMYLGKVVEYSDKRTIFKHPLHPYTEGLLKSVPVLGRKSLKLAPIEGMVPGLAEEIRGCAFASRCPHVMSVCRDQEPPLVEAERGHQVACWLHTDA
ncbi:MAG: ABC transporter ATP-binding protein, partial [Caldilineaceae bacterium]|nr:ABC transporter ATP-binding protein [Caldilineaceae bacterium]